ncbi:uncharacterized protein SPSK_04851 [Sporothrix schenckii 1099-18]|uniref:Uncharacterized protein n=2 Tax=Sporothrix schenckii TaxID=29908 RepID=U7Q2U6_SPOS1|nr:uncharacterized protein SPSK_04851 [Sporothrix schenckii 1099-18]ERT02183.1 hypothetical protein HMPREF1624_00481 [Sporothrix schenckii ATCC 58251]KJR80602.1 hypothetical protein SPSK_04851 [Sporothrix schenckii 1099-18]
MDRDHGHAAAHGIDDPRSRKGRLMGKLFGGRDRKTSNELRDSGGDDEINAFLHGPSSAAPSASSPRSSTTTRPSFDGFQVAHSAPPQLTKLDTRAISRYPNAVPVTGASHSPISSSHYTSKQRRPGVKGLAVRFVDTYPEIIGEGGDESDIPPSEIGRWRRTNSVRQARPQVAPLPNSDTSVPMSVASSRSLPLRSPLPPIPPQNAPPQQQQRPFDSDNFVPSPIRRTQTGYSSISEPSPREDHRSVSPERKPQAVPEKLPARQLAVDPFLGDPSLGRDEKRRSFIEIHQAEMREAEGRALLQNSRDGVSPPSSPEVDQKKPVSPIRYSPTKMTPPPSLPPPRNPRQGITQPALAPQNTEASPILPPPSTASTPDGSSFASRARQAAQEYSPPSMASPTSVVHRAYGSFRQNANSRLSNREHDDDSASVYSATSGGSTTSPRPPMADLHDVVQAAGDDAINTFIARSRHLFELFRLQSETIHPLSSSSAEDLARAALWWFIIGRMGLENAFRERSAQGPGADSPVSPANEAAMQQAFADLAKSYWLAGEILLDVPSPAGGEPEQVRTTLLYNLRKLAVSMKRNNILPPEDAFLPAIIDKTIWATYPPVSSDIIALLQGNWTSSLAASPVSGPRMAMLESLPIADTADDFIFSRMWADVYLMEKDRESSPHPSSKFHFPCMLSVARPQSSAMLEIVVSSQNENVQLRVQGRKNPGPNWEDVRWRSDLYSLEVRLPRGFILAIQLSKQDYGLLWSMYDFGSKIHSQLYPRSGENPIFRSTLKAFQYFESAAPTGSFPKEAVPDCDVALFSKTLQENAATGRRYYHRGFRVAVVSGTRTRTLYGVSHSYLPDVPVQFSFLRGDQGDPALLLRFENNRTKGSMVLTFGHTDERAEFHSLLTGTALQPDEQVTADVPFSSLDMRVASKGGAGAGASSNKALAAFKQLAFKRLRVINVDDGLDGTKPPTVLAEHLRMVFEFGDCTVVDRINAAPGELKIRLDVQDNTSLVLVRQAQQDFTVAVSDVQVPREIGRGLADGLRVAKSYPTCRALRFSTLTDLHVVQQAITGYKVLFDGVATTFGIARRRMVVPIHKKWEAGHTRIQVVANPDTKVVQLLAFFQDFHYGHCMSFVLKGTDVFEAFGRGSKAGIKFDDAKFPLPRVPIGDSSNGGGGSDSGASGGGGGNADDRVMSHSETAFVCLDMPDLPGEHDDISILFDKETGQ